MEQHLRALVYLVLDGIANAGIQEVKLPPPKTGKIMKYPFEGGGGRAIVDH